MMPPILFDDALDDAQPDACSYADGLGGVEGIEDLRLAFERDADAVVADADAEIGVWLVRIGGRFLRPCAHADVSMLRNGVDGVVEQIGPDLVEAGALAVQRRKVRREVLLDDDLFFAQLVGEDDHGGVDAVVDVDV